MNRSTFDTIKDLLQKHLHQELSPREQQQLDAWVSDSVENRRFFERLSDAGSFEREFRQFAHSRENILTALYQQIPALEKQPAITTRSSLRRRWATAAVLLLLAGGTYLWTANKKNAEPAADAVKTVDIAPGKEGAILTLADGSQVVLDSLVNGVIATQKGAEVLLKSGRLAYDPTGETTGQMVYNTLRTPQGRQFKLLLPDGTWVWLNAASSIRYPTAFTGKERMVQVSGEVYFEVAKNVRLPFRVNVNDRTEVEVLGTHFNVNAYENERFIKTTLLEGSVKLRIETAGQPSTQRNVSPQRTVVLKPGQQAQISDAIRVLNSVDTDKVMAWRNGLFNFEDATLEEIMRQLERWYDIEVVYEENVPNIELTGKLTRGVPLNGLLPALEKMGLKYRLEGRRLTVLR